VGLCATVHGVMGGGRGFVRGLRARRGRARDLCVDAGPGAVVRVEGGVADGSACASGWRAGHAPSGVLAGEQVALGAFFGLNMLATQLSSSGAFEVRRAQGVRRGVHAALRQATPPPPPPPHPTLRRQVYYGDALLFSGLAAGGGRVPSLDALVRALVDRHGLVPHPRYAARIAAMAEGGGGGGAGGEHVGHHEA
jgi:hypothetical protein